MAKQYCTQISVPLQFRQKKSVVPFNISNTKIEEAKGGGRFRVSGGMDWIHLAHNKT
jgi:hypothetical protein